MSARTSTIGFIGIGNMGFPMAERLARAGHRLSVHDVDASRVRAFVEANGGHALSAPTEAASNDVIITMLPSSDIVAAVFEGAGGLLEKIEPGTIVLDMSSSDPVRTRELARRVEAAGAALIDAPVSGGVPRAVTGELTIMVGGDDAIVARARPLLEVMGNSVQQTGPVGSAHAMKALNNLVSAGGFLIGVEAMLIGQRFGLDPDVMVDIFNSSTAVNNSTQKKFRQYILSRSFNAGFGLDLMVKDIGIAAALAESLDVKTPFTSLCRKMWSDAVAQLGHGRDHTEMALYSEKLVGTELHPRRAGEPAPADKVAAR